MHFTNLLIALYTVSSVSLALPYGYESSNRVLAREPEPEPTFPSIGGAVAAASNVASSAAKGAVAVGKAGVKTAATTAKTLQDNAKTIEKVADATAIVAASTGMGLPVAAGAGMVAGVAKTLQKLPPVQVPKRRGFVEFDEEDW